MSWWQKSSFTLMWPGRQIWCSWKWHVSLLFSFHSQTPSLSVSAVWTRLSSLITECATLSLVPGTFLKRKRLIFFLVTIRTKGSTVCIFIKFPTLGSKWFERLILTIISWPEFPRIVCGRGAVILMSQSYPIAPPQWRSASLNLPAWSFWTTLNTFDIWQSGKTLCANYYFL